MITGDLTGGLMGLGFAFLLLILAIVVLHEPDSKTSTHHRKHKKKH